MKLVEDLGMLLPTEKSKYKARFGLYKCKCGNTFKSMTHHIKSGRTKSCGCIKKMKMSEISKTHGLTYHRLYKTWKSMMQRCNNQGIATYKYYGGRGITVCDEWLDVRNFIEDMYPTFKEGLTLDRIDVDGNYEPSNCRWVTTTVQGRNTRKIQKNNTSGYRGVYLNKRTGKYVVQIRVNYARINLGTFTTAIDAAKAYDNYIILNNLEHTTNGLML